MVQILLGAISANSMNREQGRPSYAVCAHTTRNFTNPTSDIKAPTQPSFNTPFCEDQCTANGVYAALMIAVLHQTASSYFIDSTNTSFSFFSCRNCLVRKRLT